MEADETPVGDSYPTRALVDELQSHGDGRVMDSCYTRNMSGLSGGSLLFESVQAITTPIAQTMQGALLVDDRDTSCRLYQLTSPRLFVRAHSRVGRSDASRLVINKFQVYNEESAKTLPIAIPHFQRSVV